MTTSLVELEWAAWHEAAASAITGAALEADAFSDEHVRGVARDAGRFADAVKAEWRQRVARDLAVPEHVLEALDLLRSPARPAEPTDVDKTEDAILRALRAVTDGDQHAWRKCIEGLGAALEFVRSHAK